ncbi:MAG: hypothetical protein P4L93_08860 [Coriobacteriia bacterium]|nr:hypothetical protein [Coriobacteriia bacterium]
MDGRAARTVLTVVVDILIAFAIALAIRQFLVFSGRIAHQGWAEAFNAITAKLVIPFGRADIKTPYGGVFDVDNALTVVVFVVAEWVLSSVRDRA